MVSRHVQENGVGRGVVLQIDAEIDVNENSVNYPTAAVQYSGEALRFAKGVMLKMGFVIGKVGIQRLLFFLAGPGP